MSLLRTIIVVLLVVAVTGCRPANTNGLATNTTDTAESALTREDNPATGPDELPNTAATDADSEVSDGQAAAHVVAAADADKLPTTGNTQTIVGSRERLLLFAPDGPLLVEFVISVHSRPLHDRMQAILDDALQLADSDGDGRPLWSEVAENEALKEKYLSNGPPVDLNLTQLKQRYDLNRNDVVDRHELPRLLTGGMSGGQSFGVRGSNYYREVNRFASPTFRYLDQNADGELAAVEIEAAATRLRSRDFDQDEYIQLSDLSLDETPSGEVLFRNDEYGTAVAVWLGPRNPWSAVRFGLSELYADGGTVSPNSFALTPELFGQLDANQDGRLLLQELAGLKAIPPHLVLAVCLGTVESGQETLSLVSMCPSLQNAGVQIRSEPPWLSLLLPTSQIDFFARDLPATNNPRAEEDVTGSQVQVRVGHQADALFAALDADRDGRLSPPELDRASQLLTSMDRNDDRWLVADEIPDRMLVGLSRGNSQQADELFTRLPQPVKDQPEDVPAWFQAMDQNRDNLLSVREFLGVPEQFGQLDANHDGYVDANELGKEK